MKKPLPKAELYRHMDRFATDNRKALSWRFLGELAGVDAEHLRNVFVNKSVPLTEYVQIRVSRALERLADGDVTVMQNRWRERYLQYNQTPKPRMVKSNQLVLRDGKLELKIGIKNRNDYSEPTLEEQMGHAGSKKL
jgi:hypothetical protein